MFRRIKPGKLFFTWKQKKPTFMGVRLDFFLVSELTARLVNKTDIWPGYKTDHSFPCYTVALKDLNRGPGYWKLNTALLHDQELTTQLEYIIDQEIAQDYQNVKTKWEVIKLAIRGYTLKYSARKAKSKRNQLAVLERKLKLLDNGTRITLWLNNIEQQKALIIRDINELVEEKTRGAILRCKADWAEMGEKPSKYFLNLEKQRFNSKVINLLEREDGTKITDQKEILEEEKRFFQTLYTSQASELNISLDYLINLEFPSLDINEKEMLDERIVLEEIIEAVKI